MNFRKLFNVHVCNANAITDRSAFEKFAISCRDMGIVRCAIDVDEAVVVYPLFK